MRPVAALVLGVSFLGTAFAEVEAPVEVIINSLEAGERPRGAWDSLRDVVDAGSLTAEQQERLRLLALAEVRTSFAPDAPEASQARPILLSSAPFYVFAAMGPSESEWHTVESVIVAFLTYDEYIRYYGHALFDIFNTCFKFRPESPVVEALRGYCVRVPRPNQEEPDTIAASLDLVELGAYLLLYPYYFDHHATVWIGSADWPGYDEMPHADFLDAHREQALALYWRLLIERNDQTAALMLGYFEEPAVLEDIKAAMLTKEARYIEHGWYSALSVGRPGRDIGTHRGYFLAIERILGRFPSAGLAFTKKELAQLAQQVMAMPAAAESNEHDVFGGAQGRLAAALLLRFVPETGVETICRAFREHGPKYRYLWENAIAEILQSPLRAEELLSLLGEPDEKALAERLPAAESAFAEEHFPLHEVWSWQIVPPDYDASTYRPAAAIQAAVRNGRVLGVANLSHGDAAQ